MAAREKWELKVALKLLDEADTGRLGQGTQRAYTAAGVFGHVARAAVFLLVGYGLILAARSLPGRMSSAATA